MLIGREELTRRSSRRSPCFLEELAVEGLSEGLLLGSAITSVNHPVPQLHVGLSPRLALTHSALGHPAPHSLQVLGTSSQNWQDFVSR